MISSLATKYLRVQLRDSIVIELRTLPDARSQRFDAVGPLLEALEAAEKRGQDCYATLNRPAELSLDGGAFKDADMGLITRLPLDFDPERPAGTAATEHQVALAEARRRKVLQVCRVFRFPDPVLVHSGNGCHAIFRTHLPANDETKALLRRFYRAMDKRYSDERVKLDPTVRNPARILRVPGTINQKAGRRSMLTYLPPNWDTVTVTMINALLEAIEEPELPANVVPIRRGRLLSGSGDYSTLDVVAWFKSLGLYLVEIEAGKHGVRCPWEAEHTTPTTGSDTVVWERGDSGWATFHCSHSHCEGRTLARVMQEIGGADAFCSREWRAPR